MIIVVILLSIFTILPLLQPGFFAMHDFQQVVRLFELDKALLAGQFPVRWVQDLGFGFGYPLFNFYPPLVYYLGEIFHLAGVSFLDATKLVWGFALVGSAVSMYFLAREFFGKIAGFVAAAFYLYAPYHAVDAYVRGALAELFSFVWLPLILLFSYKKNVILTGLFLALLMLTHNLVFLPFAGLFLLWSLLTRTLKTSFLALALAFALTAFFWLPALWEKQFTLTDQFLTTGLASYKSYFVCPLQLWSSPWGFGGSAPGCVDGLSFMVGKLHLVLAALAILVIRRQRVVLATLALLLVSLFMTTDYSQFIWDKIQPLWYLQFPWRFLEFVALFSAILAGAVVAKIPAKPLRLLLAVVLVGTLLVVEGKYFRPQFREAEASDATLLTPYQVKWIVSESSFEYMPSGVAFRPKEGGGYTLDIFRNEVGRGGSISFVPNDFVLADFSSTPHRVFLTGQTKTGVKIIFPITNFPGWTAKIDGKVVPIDDVNKLKQITVDFPAGNHALDVSFIDTPVRRLGNIISLATLFALPVLFYGTRRSKT